MPDPAAVIAGYIAHRQHREAALLCSLRARRLATITDLVSDVYTDVPVQLHPIARFSVWAHLRKLAADGLAESDHPDDLGAMWAASLSR